MNKHREQKYQDALAGSGLPVGSRRFFEAGLAARDAEVAELIESIEAIRWCQGCCSRSIAEVAISKFKGGEL